MKVEFLTSIAGANFDYHAGDVLDLAEPIVRPWIRSGICRPVIETATPKRVAEHTAARLGKPEGSQHVAQARHSAKG